MKDGITTHKQAQPLTKITDVNDLDLLQRIARVSKRVVIATENEKAVASTIYAKVYIVQRDIAVNELQNLLQGLL
jgi:hypothetical protein